MEKNIIFLPQIELRKKKQVTGQTKSISAKQYFNSSKKYSEEKKIN